VYTHNSYACVIRANLFDLLDRNQVQVHDRQVSAITFDGFTKLRLIAGYGQSSKMRTQAVRQLLRGNTVCMCYDYGE
jgi:hypothetical protein